MRDSLMPKSIYLSRTEEILVEVQKADEIKRIMKVEVSEKSKSV